MNRISFQKIQLGLDLTLCSVCMLLTLHNYTFTAPMYLLWALRIWASFLLYRRTTMTSYPTGLLAVVGLLSLAFGEEMTKLLLDVVKVSLSFFGGDGRQWVHEVLKEADAHDYKDILNIVVGCVMYVWLAICPLVQYVILSAKKRLMQSSWSRRNALLLCLYLLVVAAAVVVVGYKVFWGFLVASLGVCALPYLFKGVDLLRLLTHGEKAYLSLLLVLVASYMFGYDITTQAVIAVISLPAVSYVIVNRSCSRYATPKELCLVILGGMVFWTAQYTTNMFRVLLLMLSLGLVGIAVVKFVHATQRKWRGLFLFLFVALVVPITSMGYNPFSVLHASRARHIPTEYYWGGDGILHVVCNDGYGIRDRYGIVMPTHFGPIQYLDVTKPYVKAKDYSKKEWSKYWILYDIERQEYVVDDCFRNIYPYDKYTFLLQKDSSTLYMKYRYWYNWSSGAEQYTITDTIPQ